jgi:hypothetical protein
MLWISTLGQMADLNIYSEIFGASEDESPELDHSEDTENGRLLFHFMQYEILC